MFKKYDVAKEDGTFEQFKASLEKKWLEEDKKLLKKFGEGIAKKEALKVMTREESVDADGKVIP